MEELKQKITMILDQFQKEELGNRLSQFSLLSLKSLIIAEIEKVEKKEKINVG